MSASPVRGSIGYIEAVSVELARIVCGVCAGVYSIEERYRKQKETDAGSWTCPYCKTGWGYSRHESDAAKAKRLEEELAAEQQRRRDEASRHDYQRRALRGAATRLRKRAAAGVCPCCNRSFVELARHMATKHPAYAKQDIG
jgi:hypothetical protein